MIFLQGIFNSLSILTESPMLGSSVSTDVNDAVNAAADTVAQPSFFAQYGMTIFYVLMIVAVVFFMLWQPRKEQKRKKELREGIKIGDKVMTISGMYGKVVDIAPDVFHVEFGSNKSVTIPIAKEAIELVKNKDSATAESSK